MKAERLAEIFKVDISTAKKALKILRGKYTDEQLMEFDSVRQLYNYDREYAIQLVLNELLGCYGIEAIHDPECDDVIVADYLNVGETYAPTIIFPIEGSPFIGSWGDFVESLPIE